MVRKAKPKKDERHMNRRRFGSIVRGLAPKSRLESWPNADAIERMEIPFLVLLTPPNSGSSAIAEFLAQAPGITGLGKSGVDAGGGYEGQWLVPGLAEVDRWWPEKYVNWASVAGTWSQSIKRKAAVGQVDFILEKSPPNIVRYQGLKKILEDARFVINNREPFANVASQIKRYQANIYKGAPRAEAIKHLAEQWLYRSRHLHRAQREEGFAMFSYEEFCADPQGIVEAFGLLEKIELDRDYQVRVKDYAALEIINMNQQQVAELTADEIGLIRGVLASDHDVVRQFGYKIDV